MEDAQAYAEHPSSGWRAFAVFDGHGLTNQGHLAPKRLKAQFLPMLLRSMRSARDKTADMYRHVVSAFHSMDNELLRYGRLNEDGSTAVIAVINASVSDLWLIWAGDSRAVLYETDTGRILNATLDHKPHSTRTPTTYGRSETVAAWSESKRIRAAGGTITKDRDDVPRINGMLSLSRGFGDFYLKVDKNDKQDLLNGRLSARPEMIHIPLRDGSSSTTAKKSKTIVLASDGLWDVMSNSDVGKWIRNEMAGSGNSADVGSKMVCERKGSCKLQSDKAMCQRLADYAIRTKKSSDNVSVMIIHLNT